jgi:hypothetical protein
MSKTIISECYATLHSYSEYYDDDGYLEVDYSYYADVYRILSNAEYWGQYESMSIKLVNDFTFTFGHDDFHLIVYSDGTKDTNMLDNHEQDI